MAVSWIRNTEDRIRQSVAGFQWAADHFLFLYFLMCAAIELEISTFLLFCPKYSTNSPSGPTRYMMMVWSTWRQQEVMFRHGYFLWFAALLWHVGWITTEQFITHDVVVVFVSRSLTVVNSVGSGDLLNLSLCSRQADQLWGKLWKRNYAYIRFDDSVYR